MFKEKTQPKKNTHCLGWCHISKSLFLAKCSLNFKKKYVGKIRLRSDALGIPSYEKLHRLFSENSLFGNLVLGICFFWGLPHFSPKMIPQTHLAISHRLMMTMNELLLLATNGLTKLLKTKSTRTEKSSGGKPPDGSRNLIYYPPSQLVCRMGKG